MLLTEDTAEDVHRVLFYMLRALCLTNSEKLSVAENLIIYPLADKDVKLLVKDADRGRSKGLHCSTSWFRKSTDMETWLSSE